MKNVNAQRVAVGCSALLGVVVIDSNLNRNLVEIGWHASRALNDVIDLDWPTNGVNAANSGSFA